MVKLLYLANARMPSERAHGLQIAQMCEAFARANCDVTLVVPKPQQSDKLKDLDPWQYYGVERVFKVKKLWAINIASLLPQPIRHAVRILRAWTFYLSLFVWLRGQPPDAIIYCRDVYIHWWLRWLFPNRNKVYEAHRTNHTRFGLWAQGQVLRASSLIVALTRHLASVLEAQGHRPVLVEHDGVRADRFVNMPSREEARVALNIPSNSFVAGYLGQIETLGMDKGVGTLIEAIVHCYRDRPGWSGRLLVIGGPKEKVDSLHWLWVREGLPPTAFHAAGQVEAAQVPMYLAACDVCVMPLPWTEHFAYFASPLKLFEYMAAGRAILSTDLPTFREVLSEGETALFVPPSNPQAMSKALLQLADDSELRDQIGRKNLEAVEFYTWEARANRILSALDSTVLKTAGG